MRDLLLIAAGGAFGAVGRYLGSGLAYRLFGEDFPYGTLFVNVAGCLIIGFFMQISLSTDLVVVSWTGTRSRGTLGVTGTFDGATRASRSSRANHFTSNARPPGGAGVCSIDPAAAVARPGMKAVAWQMRTPERHGVDGVCPIDADTVRVQPRRGFVPVARE